MTELNFKLTLADAGKLLDRLGWHDVVKGGAGSIAGDLRWRGSPLSIHFPTLAGALAVDVRQGQFLKADPGIAKLIGVLNMQSLPKRLALDFRDVFSEGFAFDEVAGQVKVAQGIARTEALQMRGVQAQVKIRGEADLARETQSLNVEVLPELNAGIASLAYAAIHPALGLGSLVAQYALRKPLQQMFAYEVEVTGPWSDPNVSEKIRRAPAPMLKVEP